MQAFGSHIALGNGYGDSFLGIGLGIALNIASGIGSAIKFGHCFGALVGKISPDTINIFQTHCVVL